jgi:ankyrin repeat protein
MNHIKRRIFMGLCIFGPLLAVSIFISHCCTASEAVGGSSLYGATFASFAIWICVIGCCFLLYTYRFGYRFWGIDRDRWVNGRATTQADAQAIKIGLPETPKVRLNRMDWAILLIVFVMGPGAAFLLTAPKSTSPFLLVEKNAVEAMNALINEKPELVHKINIHGETLLMAAIQSGQVDMVEFLLLHGAELNAVDRSGKTAVAYAVGQPELLDLLLQNGASANQADADGTTPLHLAIHQKCTRSCTALLKHGARVNLPGTEGLTPLVMAVNSGFNIQDLLLRYGATPDLLDQAGESALHCAARADNFEAAQTLIRAGADMNLPSSQGWTPLHVAVLNGSWTVAAFLLQEGVPVDSVNQRSQTPLHCAVHKSNQAFVEFLVEHGANVDLVDLRGNTYLHYALQQEDYDMASLLISYGAATELANNAGITPKQLMTKQNWHPKQEVIVKTDAPRTPNYEVAVSE